MDRDIYETPGDAEKSRLYENRTAWKWNSSISLELFLNWRILGVNGGNFRRIEPVQANMKDNRLSQQRVRTQAGRADDALGPNTDIGSRLRALYGAVQDEGVPSELLDLLEKLDSAEAAQKPAAKRDGE